MTMSPVQKLSSASANKKAALAVALMVFNQYTELLRAWQNSMDIIWDSPDPIGVVNELGTNAATLFMISAKTCELLETIEPNSNLDRRLKIWPHTINADGSITVTPPER